MIRLSEWSFQKAPGYHLQRNLVVNKLLLLICIWAQIQRPTNKKCSCWHSCSELTRGMAHSSRFPRSKRPCEQSRSYKRNSSCFCMLYHDKWMHSQLQSLKGYKNFQCEAVAIHHELQLIWVCSLCIKLVHSELSHHQWSSATTIHHCNG